MNTLICMFIKLLLFSMALPLVGFAADYGDTKFSPQECVVIAHNSFLVAEARDNGITKHETEVIMDTMYENLKMLEPKRAVYKLPPMTHHDLIVLIFSKCLNGDFEK